MMFRTMPGFEGVQNVTYTAPSNVQNVVNAVAMTMFVALMALQQDKDGAQCWYHCIKQNNKLKILATLYM